jgi:uncharacterized membrane protein
VNQISLTTEDSQRRQRDDRAVLAHRIGLGTMIALFLLCIAWEWWLAPLRAGGSWLILKALPLAIPIWRITFRPSTRRYTYQWATMFIWAYFTEGAVRATSDLSSLSRGLAMLEVALCFVFFVAAIIFIRNTSNTNNLKP